LSDTPPICYYSTGHNCGSQGTCTANAFDQACVNMG